MKRLISSFECSKSAQRNIDVDMIGLPEKPNGIYVKKNEFQVSNMWYEYVVELGQAA